MLLEGKMRVVLLIIYFNNSRIKADYCTQKIIAMLKFDIHHLRPKWSKYFKLFPNVS